MAPAIKEVVLSLSGGGARGAYHLGVLQYLDEHNIKVKAISATSIGSIIAASYASGVSPKRQLELLKSKDLKKVFKFKWFKKAIFDIDMDSEILQQMVPAKRIEDLPIPLYITAINLETAKEVVFTQGDLHQICKASSALAPVFEPVKIGDGIYVDGGFQNHIPIDPLLKYDLPIISVNLHPYIKHATVANIFAYLKRSIIFSMTKNIKYAKSKSDYFIESPELVNYSILSLKNFDKLFELGYKEAVKTLHQLD